MILDGIDVQPFVNQTVTTFQPRTTSIFSFTIPPLTENSQTNMMNIQVQSFQANNPFNLYLAKTTYLSIVDDKEDSIVIEGGKAIIFSSSDVGFCTNCTVFFIISVKIYSQMQVSVTTSADYEQIIDFIPYNVQVESL